MSGKQIANDIGAWSAGATWQTGNPIGNTMSQETVNFINGSGITLYTGDVVVAGSVAGVPDPTAVNATSTATAASPYVIGVVGGETNMAFAGGPIPLQTVPLRYDAVTVALSATQPDTAAVATDVGKGVFGVGIPANAYIVSVIPGTSFTMNVAATVAGATTLQIGARLSNVGPGWLGVPAGEVMPVVITGWAYINIGGNTVAAGAVLSTSTTARVAAAVTVTTYVATSPGTFIAVALEPQNGPGVIPSGDGSASVLVRSWITKF